MSQVEFFAGTALLGLVSNAPYVFTWSGVDVGTYFVSRAVRGGR